MKIIDIHVHAVGNGRSGSGCVLHPARGFQKLIASFFLRRLGLPPSAMEGDLDTLYVERLLAMIRESSVDAVVLLPSERPHDEKGRPIPGKDWLFVPDSHVLDLAERHPELLPAISVHPARADAMDRLEEGIARGAVLYKCLPNCQNIDCNLPAYRPFWERLAGAGIPLLAHTGGELTLPVVRADLADPRTLRVPLECGVTAIAAHCGTRSGGWDPDYFGGFLDMLAQYPRLYGDLSALNHPVRGHCLRRCLEPDVAVRMVHGSDFPVPVMPMVNWARGLLPWREVARWRNHPNPIEADYQIKKAMGFPDSVFERAATLLRGARD